MTREATSHELTFLDQVIEKCLVFGVRLARRTHSSRNAKDEAVFGATIEPEQNRSTRRAILQRNTATDTDASRFIKSRR